MNIDLHEYRFCSYVRDYLYEEYVHILIKRIPPSKNSKDILLKTESVYFVPGFLEVGCAAECVVGHSFAHPGIFGLEDSDIQPRDIGSSAFSASNPPKRRKIFI